MNMTEDITEQSQAEGDVVQRNPQFETLFNEAPLGIYLVDADFRIRQLNPVACAAFANVPNLIGCDFDEAIHTLWPSPDADEIVEGFHHTLETGEPYNVSNHTAERRDCGVVKSYEWQANRIPLPDGGYGVVCYFRDTSAEVQARNAIVESEERFRAIVNQTTAGVAQTDLTGRIEFLNDQFCEQIGYSREELQQIRMQDITHPDDLSRNLKLFDRLVAEGTPFGIEKRYIRKDGSIIWVRNTVSVARNAASQFHSVIAVSLDVTERKRSEALLAGQNQVLEMIARNAPLTDTLAALVRLIEDQSEGLSCSILVREPEMDRFHLGIAPSLPDEYIEVLARATILPPYLGPCGMATHRGHVVLTADIAADQRWSQEWRDLASRFGLRTCYSSPILTSNGQVLGAFGMYYRERRDAQMSDTPLIKTAAHLAGIAVERKLAEDALHKSEERLRQAIAIETVGIIFFKTDGGITDANDAFLRMSGYSRADLQHGRVTWNQMTPPEWMPQSQKAIEEFNTFGHTTPYEKEYIRKDGSRWWALFAAKRLDPGEGIEFIVDVTEAAQPARRNQQHQ
jgi:PAS domain S-box-containing protein